MSDLTHVDADGRAAMVDVSDKAITKRVAIASGTVVMAPATATAIREATLAKGDVLATARLAGIMAAKRTAEWIPLCHTLPLEHLDIDLDVGVDRVTIRATATTSSKTGVEMEALTAVSAAALTIYDMAKAIDREMLITSVGLLEKRGGKSGHWRRGEPPVSS